MRNNIASFQKTSRSRVKIMEKINAEFIFAWNFAQNLTSLLLVFSKKAILFLIYLLADKANYVLTYEAINMDWSCISVFCLKMKNRFSTPRNWNTLGSLTPSSIVFLHLDIPNLKSSESGRRVWNNDYIWITSSQFYGKDSI